MSCVETVAVAFFSLRKTADAAVFAQINKAVSSSGQYFMRIRLVSYIPYDLIFRQIERQMQSHGQFHGSQIRAEMPSRYACLLYTSDAADDR